MEDIGRAHLKNIIDARLEGTLAIFVGAGISKTSETATLKLPTWEDLIIQLKKDLSLTDENDFLKIAQLYFLEFDEAIYHKTLKKFFPDSVKPSAVHHLIFKINPNVIVTTNWDSILEKAIEENAYLYDVIAADADLVKSTNPRRLIKMHGDFKHHNLVFKEDDYLNYKYDFALIENYVRSILSTHTVLFLGYTYNDFNLKQITKWIQHYSKVKPPMYLVTYKEKKTQIKYLENHGIKTLYLNPNINGTKDYTKVTHDFLSTILNEDAKFIINSEEETIKFVYNRIKNLQGLEAILLEQIEKALSNCEFIFTYQDGVLINFFSSIATYDYKKDIRDIYSHFKTILSKLEKGAELNISLIPIFDILSKANISGIVYSQDDYADPQEYIEIIKYVPRKTIHDDFLNFNY